MATNPRTSIPLSLDPNVANRVTTTIGPEWQIMYTQGGIVMSTLLRAATLVLDRPDLVLSSMSATFVAPVTPGEIAVDVRVLRSGRGGAQVHAELVGPDGEPCSVATAVYTAPDATKPNHRNVVVPATLTRLPTPEMIASYQAPDVAFLKETEWLLADELPPDNGRSYSWFRFLDNPVDENNQWEREWLTVPGDQLGGAVDTILGLGTAFCVSLQISATFYGTARGEWIGVDSVAWEISDGIASGYVSVFDSEAELVANFTQIAKLRTEF